MPVAVSSLAYTMKLEFNVSGNPIYIGFANPPAGTALPMWAIQKLTWDGDNPTDIQWANGSASFSFIWNSRGSYNYL